MKKIDARRKVDDAVFFAVHNTLGEVRKRMLYAFGPLPPGYFNGVAREVLRKYRRDKKRKGI